MSGENYTEQNISAICPRCQKGFGPSLERCPHDGVKLLLVQQGDSRRVGMVIDEKYTLLGQLGRGGMGTVYRALQHNMEREVAVKVMHDSVAENVTAVKRFLREAKQASRLNHPHIITLFDFGQTERGELYMVMEMLHGKRLGDLMDEEGALSPKRGVRIVTQVCDALDHAHQKDIIHRDLKPENIFLLDESLSGGAGEYTKVLDFGLAKIVGEESHDSLTRTGMISGTPAYMSPEHISGVEIDGRSDVYSIGIVLYELLCGSRPFLGTNPMELCLAHVNAVPRPMSENSMDVFVAPELEQVVMRALNKKPEDRQQTAGMLQEELVKALDMSGGATDTLDRGAVFRGGGNKGSRSGGYRKGGDKETLISMTMARMAPGGGWSNYVGAAAVIGGIVLAGWWGVGSDSTYSVAPSLSEGSEGSTSNEVGPGIGGTGGVNITSDPTTANTEASKGSEDTPGVSDSKNDTGEGNEAEKVVKGVRIETKPQGATITVDGVEIGASPIEIGVPEQGKTVTVIAKLKGYQVTEKVVSDKAFKVVLVMKPNGEAPPNSKE